MDNDFTPHAHLFMVRVWLEDLGEGKTEWRGKLQCIASGEVKYFRDWQTLTTELSKMLPCSTKQAE